MESELDFGAIALFWQADWVVKAVMIILLAASIWSWSIAIAKWGQFKKVGHQARKFSKQFWSGEPLDGLFHKIRDESHGAMADIFKAGMIEWSHSHESGRGLNVNSGDRIGRATEIAFSQVSDRWQSGMSTLASIAAVAPFIGLFGTVWGIQNAFSGIAESQSTSLAVVAPGIAEALFATALGLLAAIPAVIFYNKFSRDIERLELEHEAFAEKFMVIVRRQLDEAEG